MAPDRLLAWLLRWTALTTLVFWLPTVRGPADGPSYTWSLFSFGGSGISGDYYFPLLGAAAALLTQWLGWRGQGRVLLYGLLALWHVTLVASALYLVLTEPDDFRLRGDTMGIDISLAFVAPLLCGAWAIATAYWIYRDARRPRPQAVAGWTTANRIWIAILLGLLPVQWFLLHHGAPGSRHDQVGVVLTIAQWLLVGRALRH